MASRRQSTLAVFLATVVVAVGVVVVVATSRGAPAAGPASGTRRTAGPTLTVDSGCRLGAGPESLANVPEQVTARVDRAWARIETWLKAHAPVSAASLRPPADDEAIADAQRRVGVRLPAELVASLRRHDGVDQEDITRTFVLRRSRTRCRRHAWSTRPR